MVIFQTPDGNPGYNQFETIEEAVRFVEVLRNEQGVENARMFALEEVQFDFKPYYRVELDPPMLNAGPPQGSSQPASSAPTAQQQPPSSPQSPPAPQAPLSQGPGPESAPPAPRPPAQPSSEGPGNGFRPTEGAAPSSPPPAPSAPSPQESSPVGSEAPVSTVPPPTFMAGASEREEQPATTRRGLFGR